jgi:hypothetical protein
MRIALWIVVAVTALLWTAGAALAASVAGWAATQVAAGAALQAGSALAQIPVPAWLAVWLDPALLRSAQEALLWTLQSARDALPWAAAALGWLVPVVWVAWGLGLTLLLIVAVALQLLVGRAAAMFGAPAPVR